MIGTPSAIHAPEAAGLAAARLLLDGEGTTTVFVTAGALGVLLTGRGVVDKVLDGELLEDVDAEVLGDAVLDVDAVELDEVDDKDDVAELSAEDTDAAADE